jgi:L-seryl-tRNA(Ser) seleniumtransferase
LQSEVRLKEVGSTNRTRAADFSDAINENTGLLMKAHSSNYKIIGFTEDTTLESLVALGQKYKLPVVHDLGSGAFWDLKDFSLPSEPRIADSLKAGVDLVFFSADKLLGGPQAGLILGKKKYVDRCRKNPLARALRVGKMTLLALESLLDLYRENNFEAIPLYNRLSMKKEMLKKEAETLAEKINACVPWKARVESFSGRMGSGSSPEVSIPSYRLKLFHPDYCAEALAEILRQETPGIYGQISKGHLTLNILTIFPEEQESIVKVLKRH